MGLSLANYQAQTREAIKVFWSSRGAALDRQDGAGQTSRSGLAAVVGGKNLDGFIALIRDLVVDNGLPGADVHVKKGLLVLPGYFRPTKQWDLLVMNGGRLVAAFEFKSHVGSFSNNFNNRAEEAIGSAHCLWTAYREGALGAEPRPFLGWLMVVEDAPRSRSPARFSSPHFQVFPDFRGSSYLQRYDLLCQKLVREQLYSAACVLTTPRNAVDTGDHGEMSPLSGLEVFVTAFAGHIAAEAARTR